MKYAVVINIDGVPAGSAIGPFDSEEEARNARVRFNQHGLREGVVSHVVKLFPESLVTDSVDQIRETGAP